MIFCVSSFILFLEATVREQLNGNDFGHCYDFFFRKYRPETAWSSYVQSSFAAITGHFENAIWNDTLPSKMLWTWITIWTNFFLSKYLSRKIDEGAWKIIIYRIAENCTKTFHLLLYASFSLK